MRMNVTKQAGFSLIELMIVVGIIGLLATIAVPKMSSFSSRAKQGESAMILSNIATLQAAYSIEAGKYVGYSDADSSTAADTFGRNIGLPEAGNNCAPTNARLIATNSSLGFTIEPCAAGKGPRYAYNIAVLPATETTVFRATAYSGAGSNNLIFPGKKAADGTTDCVDNKQINQARTQTNIGGTASCN